MRRLRFDSYGVMTAAVIAVAVMTVRSASADVITIDDGGMRGTTSIPFTCALGDETNLWLPTMGFFYRRVEPFQLVPGDTIAFDIQMQPGDPDNLGFLPQVDIALAHVSDANAPFKPDDLPGSDFTIVAHSAKSSGPGNRVLQDYDLVFTADAPFSFPGGGLIIRVSNPQGPLATRGNDGCLPVITADVQPTGTNRLVGVFKADADGEFPFIPDPITNGVPGVPYVRITWSRCGDGVLTASEECDNSADPAHPDPFCDGACHLNAFAKGSGCSTGGGVGLALALVLGFVLLKRRRAAGAVVVIGILWAGSAQAQVQRKTDGFRVDPFETAPSVDDGIVVQDPTVLRNMQWSMNAALGFSNTLLRVVPTLSSNTGIDVVGSRLSAYLDFALGLGNRFEVDASLPFAVAQSSEAGIAAGTMLRSAGAGAIGDARFGGSMMIYRWAAGPEVGVAATVSLPTGSKNSFTGDGGVGGELLATAGLSRPGYRLVANAGVRLRPEADYISSDQGTELVGRAGVFVPLRPRLMTSLELDMTARAAGRDAFHALGSPILPIVGARYHFEGGFRAGAGVGFGLTQAPGSPAVRVLVTFGYSPEPEAARLPPRPIDSDGDGIPDKDDKCPTEPEDFNGFEDADGCPDADKLVPPDPNKPLTLEDLVTLPAPIEFKFDTAIMLPGSEVYLNQVLDILQKHPEVLKLEIQGHTSSEGGPEYNMRLSNDRAHAVFTWLTDRGVDPNRLVPHGYGLTQPLVPNDTEPNRQRNRRVQFRLLEQTPGTKPIGQHTSTPQPPPSPGGLAPAKEAPEAAPPPAAPPPAAPPSAEPAALPPATPPPAAPPPSHR